MAIKVGNRVTVLPGVSNRTDAGSVFDLGPGGYPRSHLVGKRGEVVEVRADGCCLVDDQVKDGSRIGSCTMREWFRPEEVEVG